VPLSLVKYSWFLENISSRNKPAFDAVKRFMDLFISIVVGLVSLPIYPFVILAIKIDDGGPIFSIQERVGQNNRIIKLYKFRTMDRANDGGKWNQNNENKITRIGALLRKTRIDELPQLWNVFRGEISLIGPRPEFPEPVKLYEKQVPYYRVRHLVKPGLSGWAQIHHENDPHHQVDITETKNKLSYDLYYINNRSYLLDMEIALKTIRILLSFQGK
jgi:lipopolysaccharide/colanic/teichoic acid biosynthesis glycosyltransferase